MMVLKKLIALTLAVGFPFFAAAQTAEPAKPAAPATPKVSVTPYGFVQGSAFFDQNTFTNKDYPGQVARDQIGGSFLMSARYSRFGVKLALDDQNWTGATLGGEIEFDFKGGQAPTTVTGTTPTAPSSSWYNGLMRLRLADVTATWKAPYGSWQILAGQNYGLVNPLFATTITWTADPLFWMAGNAWRRDPQFRLTYTGTPELLGLNVAVAMLSPHTNDAIGGPFTAPDYGSGNAYRMPDLEGRVGINAKVDPVTIAAGVGYSYGKRRVIDQSGAPVLTKPTKDIDGSLLGVDVSVGSQFADVKGEFFTQKGRGDTYNVIGTSIGTTAGFQKAAESTGFWAQAVLKPIPEVSVTAGYAQEEVKKGSLADAGITSTATRTKNSQFAAGVIVNAGKFWKFGVEGIQTKTEYLGTATVAALSQTGTQLAISTQLVF